MSDITRNGDVDALFDVSPPVAQTAPWAPMEHLDPAKDSMDAWFYPLNFKSLQGTFNHMSESREW